MTSPSSAATDRREKQLSYLTIPTLTDYLVVDQENPRVERHIWLESGEWVLADHIGECEFMLPSPSVHLTFAEIHAGA